MPDDSSNTSIATISSIFNSETTVVYDFAKVDIQYIDQLNASANGSISSASVGSYYYTSDLNNAWSGIRNDVSNANYQDLGINETPENRQGNSNDTSTTLFTNIINEGATGFDRLPYDPVKIRKEAYDEDEVKVKSLLKRTMRANSVFDRGDMLYNTAFYRFPRPDPYNYVDGAREYVFITKVDLPLLDEHGKDLMDIVADIPYFADLWSSSGYRKSVFQNLCYSLQLDGSNDNMFPFMRILTNRKTSNIDLPDIQADELETSVNMYGSKILYSKSSALSDENIDFSIEFEDTRHLEIYNLFKAYDTYERLKYLGVLGPGVKIVDIFRGGVWSQLLEDIKSAPRRIYERVIETESQYPDDNIWFSRYLGYISNRILYDHMSLYKFLVATDGYTILHGSKITGIYPRSISRSSFSEIPDKGPLKISVGFKASGWLEDNNMSDLMIDFNSLVYNYAKGAFTKGNVGVPIYDQEISMVSQELVDYPFIMRSDKEDMDGFYRYYLMWGISDNFPHKDRVLPVEAY